jgi:hypothetical protein
MKELVLILFIMVLFKQNVLPSLGIMLLANWQVTKTVKKHKLPIKDYSLPKQDDAWGLNNLLFNDDGDYITF